jgi:hypothetical protein
LDAVAVGPALTTTEVEAVFVQLFESITVKV